MRAFPPSKILRAFVVCIGA